MLHKISEHHEKLLNIYNDENYDKTRSDYEKLIELIDTEQNLYRERKKMPVWPYDFELFLKFGAVFLRNFGLYLFEILKILFGKRILK